MRRAFPTSVSGEPRRRLKSTVQGHKHCAVASQIGAPQQLQEQDSSLDSLRELALKQTTLYRSNQGIDDMDFLNAELCAAKAAEAELDHELHLTIQQYSKKVDQLEDALDEARQQAAASANSIEAGVLEVTELRAETKSSRGEISRLQAEVKGLQEEVTQLDVMLDSPETRAEYEGVTEDMQLKIGFLQAEVEGLEAKLSASQHREAAARNELQASKLAFTQAGAAEVSELKSMLQVARGDVARLKDELKWAQDEATQLAVMLDSPEPRAAYCGVTEGLHGKITSLEGEVEWLRRQRKADAEKEGHMIEKLKAIDTAQITADLNEQLSAAQQQNSTLTTRLAQLQQLMESQHRAAATQQKACTPSAKGRLGAVRHFLSAHKGRASGACQACSPGSHGNLCSVFKDSTEHEAVVSSPLVGPLKATFTELEAIPVTPLTDGKAVPIRSVLQPTNQSPFWKPAAVTFAGLQPVPVAAVPSATGGSIVGSVQQHICQNLYGLAAKESPIRSVPAQGSARGTGQLSTKSVMAADKENSSPATPTNRATGSRIAFARPLTDRSIFPFPHSSSGKKFVARDALGVPSTTVGRINKASATPSCTLPLGSHAVHSKAPNSYSGDRQALSTVLSQPQPALATPGSCFIRSHKTAELEKVTAESQPASKTPSSQDNRHGTQELSDSPSMSVSATEQQSSGLHVRQDTASCSTGTSPMPSTPGRDQLGNLTEAIASEAVALLHSTPKPASRMQHLLTGVTAAASKLTRASKPASACKLTAVSQPTSKPGASEASDSHATPSAAACVSPTAVERSSCAAANLAVSCTAEGRAATCSLVRCSTRSAPRNQASTAKTAAAALERLLTPSQPTESGQVLAKTIGKNGSAGGNAGKGCRARVGRAQAAKQAHPQAAKLTQVKNAVNQEAQTGLRRSGRIATADAAASMKPSWNQYTKAS